MSKKKKKDKKKHKGNVPAQVKGASKGEKAESLDLRSVKLPTAPKPMKPAEIKEMREKLNASQALFAKLLNVSSNAVESWEQGARAPRQATLKLLYIARNNPAVLLD
jgi:DNA-binding transcriptional regulator YiaG